MHPSRLKIGSCLGTCPDESQSFWAFLTITVTTHYKLVEDENEQAVNKAATCNTCYNWVWLMLDVTDEHAHT